MLSNKTKQQEKLASEDFLQTKSLEKPNTEKALTGVSLIEKGEGLVEFHPHALVPAPPEVISVHPEDLQDFKAQANIKQTHS